MIIFPIEAPAFLQATTSNLSDASQPYDASDRFVYCQFCQSFIVALVVMEAIAEFAILVAKILVVTRRR